MRSERGQLVVTGSSTGGIAALSQILSVLPADFGAPIVVAQHLSPSTPSNLAGILAKSTPLRVVVVTGEVPLEPATVYVVPADRNVEITDHAVNLAGDGQRPKPSVDLLFSSAAAHFGDRLIAVVLTGMGRDGMLGAREVKRLGGTVLIEDPRTAVAASMPGSLDPSLVDRIEPLERIGPALARLIEANVDVSEESPEFASLLERIHNISGIDFSEYKMATIKRRLARQIAAAGVDGITAYTRLLDDDPTELGRLVGKFLIKVTEFFRDREMFEALRAQIVPALIDHARTRGRELRLWSAGCATGEEAYSLAILVADALARESDEFSVRIFATDIDEAVIAFARRGIYSNETLANVAPHLLERYFTRTDEGWEVARSIRGLTVFGQHDLGKRAPFPRIDLALCRNVLIYFSRDLQHRTLQIFASSIRDGGYLALGKAEMATPLAEYFDIADPTLRIFRRNAERVAIPSPLATRSRLNQPEIERPMRALAPFEGLPREGRAPINERLGFFLTASEIGVILVDRRYDIVSINPTARSMFGIYGNAIGDDLIHLLPADAAAPVRALIDAALRGHPASQAGSEAHVRIDGIEGPSYVRISGYPEINEITQSVGGVVLFAVDVSDEATKHAASAAEVAAYSRELAQLRAGEHKLRETQRGLIEANRRLAFINAELRAQNDSLVIAAEEAEAATDDVKALNEEMQATNEELETLNEEFQATIEELTTTNDEHEARVAELEQQLEDLV